MSTKQILSALAFMAGQVTAQTAWKSPQYNHIFEFPLPIPPTKAPLTSVTNATTGRTVDFYEIGIESMETQIYPDLPATQMTGYDGISPGPTFRMTRGRESVVRFVNNYDRPSSIHLHGSFSRAPFDGWADDLIEPDQYKDYYYPNAQPARTLWYHDHAVHITAENANLGQSGFYILEDPQVDFGIPKGEYDIPLSIASRLFTQDAQIIWNATDPAAAGTFFHGDVVSVNGQPWPYLNVEPRKYRFRLLDSAVARVFNLSLTADVLPNTRIPFTVISSDSGYLSRSVITSDLVISMGERWDIVVDFSEFEGQNVTMKNQGNFANQINYPATDRVMKFVVGDTVTDTSSNGAVPETLQTLPTEDQEPVRTRDFTFAFSGGKALINGVGFADAANRVLANPVRGQVERWRLINPGGPVHPIHIHLVDFQVVSRTGGRGAVTPYEAAGLKDMVTLGSGETIEVLANFAPWPGVYMFHCHNLIHEDNDMMAAFNVTLTPEQLEELGYGPDSLLDPESEEFAAKPFTAATDISEIRDTVIPNFVALNAYPEIARVAAAEWVPADSPQAAAAPLGFAPPEKRAVSFAA